MRNSSLAMAAQLPVSLEHGKRELMSGEAHPESPGTNRLKPVCTFSFSICKLLKYLCSCSTGGTEPNFLDICRMCGDISKKVTLRVHSITIIIIIMDFTLDLEYMIAVL